MIVGLMLTQYHIIFIVITFIFLIYAMELILKNDGQSNIFAMIVCAINCILCVINYLGFFGIGLIGYQTDGTVDVNLYVGMWPVYMFFFGMYWVNVILIFYCWYRHTHNVFDISKTKK